MELNYDILLEINTTPSAAEPTWARVGDGFKNLSPSLNEVIYQASYLVNEGWGSSEVTGGQFTTTLTGDRVPGDDAQDFIFSSDVQFKFGASRKTQFRITQANGRMILWPITLANITETGGDSNQPNAISVTIHGNGKPTITEAESFSALALSSIVPAADATEVSKSASIVLTFNNKIDNSDGIFLVNSPTGAIVTVTKSWNAAGKVLTIDPVSDLTASQRHAVIISGVRDIYGQSLSNTISYFTTEA